MKILITGGAGFIGSTLADKLLSEGHHVLVIDNYATGRKENLTAHPSLQVIEGTIADEKLVNDAFDAFVPEQVVHAAASYKNPDNWTEDTMTNILGTVNVVKASQKHKVKRLVYFQTSLCYGLKPLEQPITLNHPLFSGTFAAGSSYAISKTAGEQYIEMSGLDFVSFRLANAYGPRNLSGPLPTFYNRLSKGQKCFISDTRRDFIFVNDLVEVVERALHGKGHKGFYHISTGSDYSIQELFDNTVKHLTHLTIEAPDKIARGADDVATILIDPSKTEKDFEWKPTTKLDDGIQKTIEWYKANIITETFTHLKLDKK